MSRDPWHSGGHHHGPGGGPGPTLRPPPPLAPPRHNSSSYYTQPQHQQSTSHPKHFGERPPPTRFHDEKHGESHRDHHRESPMAFSDQEVYSDHRAYSDQGAYSDPGSHSDRKAYSDRRGYSGQGGYSDGGRFSDPGGNSNQGGYSTHARYAGGNYSVHQPFDGYAEESNKNFCYETERRQSISGERSSKGQVSTSHSFPEVSGQQPSFETSHVGLPLLPSPVYSQPPPGFHLQPPPSAPSASSQLNPCTGSSTPPGSSLVLPPAPSPAPPPAPHIGSLTPESKLKVGTRDPRRRLRGEVSEDERSSGPERGGLGIRNDIYAAKASAPMENRGDVSYHQPEAAPQPQLEDKEVKFADTDAFSKMPDSTVVDVEEESKEGKVSTNYRCTFCPSPGLIPLTEKITHQALHANSCFSCAACGGRRTFPDFEKLVLHIHSLHMVTDSEMVRETILLPEAGPGALKVFRCGVTNCGITFTAQAEVVLRAHMEAVHGSYYVKLGKGKYLLRFCRICGEERCFTTEKELLAHISTCHPPDQFGQRLSDGEEEETEVKQEVVDEREVNINNNNSVPEVESLTSGLMNTVGNRPRNIEPSPEPSTSSVLAQEAIELAAKTISPKEAKEEKKRKRKKKHVESTSEESSESTSDDEEQQSKKKKKSKKGVKEKSKKKAPIEEKKKKFKDQVGRMSPEEIRQHILKMKEKADKLLKKKSFKELKEDSGAVAKKRLKAPLKSLPDPKVPWPRTVNDKTAHYFCLVCNIYAGKLERWLLHRDQMDHIEAFSSTKEAALQRHDCAEINLQECVIGEEKFEKTPIGQCRECFQVFWCSTDPESHLRDGRCLKTAKRQASVESPEKGKSRSPSPPFIKWKPLRKPMEKAWDEDEVTAKKGKEENRVVSYQSPSPPKPVPPPSVQARASNLPKYMLDGRVAYYICRVCRTPIGNLLAWLKHVTTENHREAMQKNPAKVLGKEKHDEVMIASTPSVLYLFGDSCNFCLPCNLAVPSSSALLSHEQLEQHKAAARAMELRDRDSLAKEGSDLPTIFHCSLCNLSTSSLPSTHLTSAGHRRKEDETSPCLYCPTRVVPDSLTAHQKKFHPKSEITCNFCGEKFKLGGPGLVAHANGHLHPGSVSTASETVEKGVMAMPDDLRRMRCRKCGLQFLGQDITEVTNHVLAMHTEVEARLVIEVGVELSCQLCLMVCATEAELTEHIHSAHKNSPKKDADLCAKRRGQVVSVSGVKYKRYGSISPPPRSPRPRSRTRSPPSSYSNKKLATSRRSPSYSTRSRSGSRSPGRRSRSHGKRSRSHGRRSGSYGRRSGSYGRRSRTPPRRSQSQPRWSRSPGRRSRSPIRRSRSPRRRSRSPRPRSRTSPVKRRPRRRSSGGGGSPTYSPYRRPSTPPTPRSRSPSPQIVSHSRRTGWSRTSSYGGGGSRRWRSPTPPPRPEPVLSLEEREERKEEESKLLERLRNDKSKELSANDLREKLESKKCVMLDSRGEVKVEGSGINEKRACPICSNKFNDDSLLLQHMKMEHRRDMFGCSKCQGDKQPAIGWSVEVLVQHLASAHELNVTISDAISGFLAIPESLHKVTCKLCPPPHILGSQGFWLAGDVAEHMISIEEHFEQVHLMSEKPHIVGKLELACRGCDFILPHSGANKMEWADHLRRNHARLNRKDSRANRAGPRKRCDFCGDQVVQTEAVRHIKEEHARETFQCKLCLAADPACFPYAETIKEMTGHMVLKHKDVETYYEHMIYPETLYGAICSGKDCAQRGKILAFNPAALGKHLREHQDQGEDEVGEIFCRCCDRVKERFKTPVEVEVHISKRHKQLLKCRGAEKS